MSSGTRPISRRTATAILGGLLLTAGACANGEEAPPRFVQGRDASGTLVVRTHQLAWEDPIPLPVGGPVTVVSGEGSGTVIGRVGGAVRLSSGAVVVSDTQVRQLVEFSAAGELVRIMGGPGDGPGEFRSLRTLSRIRGDTVAVYDPLLRRLSFFPPDGGECRTVTLQDEELFPGETLHVWALGGDDLLVLDGGSLQEAAAHPTSGAAVFGPPAVLRAVSLADRTSREVFRGGHASESIQTGATFWAPVFGRAMHVSLAEGAQAVLTTSMRHTILRFDPSSWVLTEADEFPDADTPLTEAEVKALWDEVRELEAVSGAQFRTPEMLFEQQLQPDARPAFSDLLVAPNGYALARVFEPLGRSSAEWWVIGPQGDFRGRVRAPGRGDLLEIGDDYVLGAVYDEYDVPTVEVRALDWSRLAGGPARSRPPF